MKTATTKHAHKKDTDRFGTRIATMNVKAKDGAMVYDQSGNAIPGDSFVSVPVSPTLVLAVRNGDLEEMEADPTPPSPEAPVDQESREHDHRRHRREQRE